MTYGRLRCLALALGCLICNLSYSQHVAVKTNALYWTTATFNAGVETRLSKKWTLDVSAGWNPFTFSDNKKLKHVVVQPEARYWLCAPYAGHFIGANILYSHYNAGGVRMPFGVFPDLDSHRFQGDLFGAGIGYGYHWILNNRWSIEAEIGFGAAYVDYDKYECATCGDKVGSDQKVKLMPTKAAVSLIYIIK